MFIAFFLLFLICRPLPLWECVSLHKFKMICTLLSPSHFFFPACVYSLSYSFGYINLLFTLYPTSLMSCTNVCHPHCDLCGLVLSTNLYLSVKHMMIFLFPTPPPFLSIWMMLLKLFCSWSLLSSLALHLSLNNFNCFNSAHLLLHI